MLLLLHLHSCVWCIQGGKWAIGSVNEMNHWRSIEMVCQSLLVFMVMCLFVCS